MMDPEFVPYVPEQHGSLERFVVQQYPCEVEYWTDELETIYMKRGWPRVTTLEDS